MHVDKLAKQRCTSVYMPHTVYPMLPHALCNHLCSLNPNENKMAFSVFYRIKDGLLLLDKENEPYIKKTVINTCVRFAYDDVQVLYDHYDNGTHGDLEGDDRPVVHHGADWEDIKKDLMLLYRECGKVRKERYGNGALQLHKSKLIFLRDANGEPAEYITESHSASHWVIEELMLLANRSVARIMLNHAEFDEIAILRNHPPPDQEKAKKLMKLMEDCRMTFDNSTAASLHLSLQNIQKKFGNEVMATVSNMVMRCGMRQAAYFSGMKESPHHFALNFDVYTHFTSPIRRYADVLVHRVLNAILQRKTVEDFQLQDMDDEDRMAKPEGDSNSLMKNLPELNCGDLSDDEDIFNNQGKLTKKFRQKFENKSAASALAATEKDDSSATSSSATGAKKTKKKAEGGEAEGNEEGDEDEDDEGANQKPQSQANIALNNQCQKCNEKKKAAKDCQENLDRAWFCMYLRKQHEWWYRQATVLEISEKGVTVFAHEIGKEKLIPYDTRVQHQIPDLFVTGVPDEIFLPEEWELKTRSHIRVKWVNKRVENPQFLYGDDREDLEEQAGEVIKPTNLPPGFEDVEVPEQEIWQDIHQLSVVPIVLIPTKTVPIDFVMLMVSPYHAKHKTIKITEREKQGFNFVKEALVSSEREGGDTSATGDDDVSPDARRNPRRRGGAPSSSPKGAGKGTQVAEDAT